MQALCQWDVQRDSTPRVLQEFLAAQEATVKSVEYASALVEAFWSQSERIDRAISSATHKWDLQRISPVERNTMRVAVAESIAGAVPIKVILNEAIEITREFGGAESPSFVNGVLDEVLKHWDRSAE